MFYVAQIENAVLQTQLFFNVILCCVWRVTTLQSAVRPSVSLTTVAPQLLLCIISFIICTICTSL